VLIRARLRALVHALSKAAPGGWIHFNPIEKAFAKLKALLRKAAERTVSGLWDLIGKLVDLFQPTECANYFSSCGYDPE
jgi:transposase